jgi:hypothetical protein
MIGVTCDVTAGAAATQPDWICQTGGAAADVDMAKYFG